MRQRRWGDRDDRQLGAALRAQAGEVRTHGMIDRSAGRSSAGRYDLDDAGRRRLASRAMPRFPWLLLLAFVLCSRPAAPADQPQEQPPTQYTTTVQGTVPDLTGRWLVVGYVGLRAKEGSVPISLGWNITQSHGK